MFDLYINCLVLWLVGRSAGWSVGRSVPSVRVGVSVCDLCTSFSFRYYIYLYRSSPLHSGWSPVCNVFHLFKYSLFSAQKSLYVLTFRKSPFHSSPSLSLSLSLSLCLGCLSISLSQWLRHLESSGLSTRFDSNMRDMCQLLK